MENTHSAYIPFAVRKRRIELGFLTPLNQILLPNRTILIRRTHEAFDVANKILYWVKEGAISRQKKRNDSYRSQIVCEVGMAVNTSAVQNPD